ncbi:MAG: lycopene cyclase domain-containing protein [Chlorobiota bacterium]|jgi:putative membrane protein|nr:lycopene cyclase domain-containing protein [Chlorobiota bacterium]QQS66929.1 MAG: lycopene cyclase domain-containing protein [Chlorobiota bacterium]
MTYFQFHLYFNLPLILLLLILNLKNIDKIILKWIVIVCLIALSFTFIWDNHAISMGIWEFPNDRIMFRILKLPIEEILFFIIESIVVCLTVLLFLPKVNSKLNG